MPGPRGNRDLFARVVEAIKELGTTNLTWIAKRVGTSAPTVHYYLTKRFSKLGIQIRAIPNIRRLGLDEYLVRINFNVGRELATAALDFLGYYNYLSYYARRVPDGCFITIWSVPRSLAGEWAEMLNAFEDSDLIEHYEARKLPCRRTLSLRPEFFDARRNAWKVDWSEVARKPVYVDLSSNEESTVNFDETDLLILKELQKNALIKRAAIARAVGKSDKTVQFHWLHVEAYKLIEDWAVGVFYGSPRKYSYLFVLCDQCEVEEATAALAKLPFTWRIWALDGRKGALACLTVPKELLEHSMAFLADVVPRTARVEMWLTDPSTNRAFIIPYKMYVGGSWTFDWNATLSSLVKYIKKVGGREGSLISF